MKRIQKYLVWISLVVVILITCVACQNVDADSKDYDYSQQKIKITGLQEKDFTVTVAQLMELESVTEKAEASRFNGEKVTVKAVGPTLNTFLKQYNKSQRDFATIRFTAKDKYSIAVPKEILENRDIILAYSDGGKPLTKEDQPLHVVVPGERAMYWVRMLAQIDFETEAGAVMSQKVVFLDTAVKTLTSVEYKDESNMGSAVKTSDLIQKYAGNSEVEKVYLAAGDGLKKSEIADTFLSAYIKYTGDGAPKYLAPHFPEGMKINEILNVNYGDTAFYSLEEGFKTLKKQQLGQYEGIAFTDILKGNNFKGSMEYQLTDKNQNSIILTEKQMSEGIFCEQDGIWSYHYGEKGNAIVKDVLQIEAVQ